MWLECLQDYFPFFFLLFLLLSHKLLVVYWRQLLRREMPRFSADQILNQIILAQPNRIRIFKFVKIFHSFFRNFRFGSLQPAILVHGIWSYVKLRCHWKICNFPSFCYHCNVASMFTAPDVFMCFYDFIQFPFFCNECLWEPHLTYHTDNMKYQKWKERKAVKRNKSLLDFKTFSAVEQLSKRWAW